MSERKVLNKYFPPDFDPAKIPRRKIAKDAQQVVRLMAPFTMCCKTCGEFIYKGKKFNAKKETALGEEYYGIKVFRFYIKCTRCSAEITFKTDPKNADYICEHGATRNYEPTTEKASAMPNAADDDSDAGAESDPEDPMKALEASQANAKRQMEDEDDLADLRQRNARIQRNEIDSEAILAAQHAESAVQAAARRKQQEEEDEIVKKYFYKVAAPAPEPAGHSPANGEGNVVGGLGPYGDSDDDEDGPASRTPPKDVEVGTTGPTSTSITVKRKPPPSGSTDREPTVAELLASKGVSLHSASVAGPSKTPTVAGTGKGTVVGGAIKRKTLANSLGIKVAIKKKKV